MSYNEAINCIVEVVSMAGILRSDLLQGLFIRLCTVCEICVLQFRNVVVSEVGSSRVEAGWAEALWLCLGTGDGAGSPGCSCWGSVINQPELWGCSMVGTACPSCSQELLVPVPGCAGPAGEGLLGMAHCTQEPSVSRDSSPALVPSSISQERRSTGRSWGSAGVTAGWAQGG